MMRKSDSPRVRADYSALSRMIPDPFAIDWSIPERRERRQMYEILSQWRARRVLLIGRGEETTQLVQALLTALGARPVRLPPEASAEALYRVLTCGRVSAVIVCDAQALFRLPGAKSRLLTEIHQTGIPLTLFCPRSSAQEAALRALMFGAQFFEEGELPCGVYDLETWPPER